MKAPAAVIPAMPYIRPLFSAPPRRRPMPSQPPGLNSPRKPLSDDRMPLTAALTPLRRPLEMPAPARVAIARIAAIDALSRPMSRVPSRDIVLIDAVMRRTGPVTRSTAWIRRLTLSILFRDPLRLAQPEPQILVVHLPHLGRCETAAED